MTARSRTSSGRRALLRALSLSVLAWGCSDPPTGPGGDDGPAAVAVTPGAATLVSLGDTATLSATVRSASGGTLSSAVTWTSSATGVATVDGEGRVVAVGNGTAVITAAAGGAEGTASVTVQQAVDSLAASGDAQSAGAGSALDSAVVVRAFDARGHPVAGAPVSFGVLSGGGSVDPAAGTTDGTGAAAAAWTLGTTSGIQELEAAVGADAAAGALVLSATALALEPVAVAAYAGDDQTEIPGQPVPSPMEVRVVDRHGNGVPDVLVTFEVEGGAGDAALDAVEVSTGLDGVAGVRLTLGSALGGYAVTAAVSVADSLDPEPRVLDGSPVTLGAEAVAFALAPPDSIVVGDTVVLAGAGFHPEVAANVVTLGGVAVTVLEGTQSSLTLEVPDLGCVPQAVRTLSVSRPGGGGDVPLDVTPAGALTLAVGGRAVLDDPADFCLQLLPGSDQEYLVGLTATRWFDASTTFALTGRDAAAPAPALAGTGSTVGSAELRVHEAASSTGAGASPAGPGASPRTVEYALRSQEADLIESQGPSAAPPAPGPVFGGELLDLRVPDLRGDACTEYLPVSVEVVYASGRLAVATSAALPEPGTLAHATLIAALDNLLSTYGATGIDIVATYLGAPQDWDGTSQILLVLVPEVGLMGVPAFASAVDQLPRTACASSDEDRIVYMAIPEAATVSDFQDVLAAAPPHLTHHIAHIIQWTRRLPEGGSLLPSFLAEGQAEAAVERVGLALTGLWGSDEMTTAVLALPGVDLWIPERFDRLSYFQGWDGAGETVAGAPEGCSLFGFQGACEAEAAPGAGWSFLRYLGDRFGDALPGGEDALQSALIDVDPAGDPLVEVGEILGVAFPTLMVDWAAALQLDGELTPAQAPELQIPSWALESWLTAGGRVRHTPPEHPLAAFDRTGSVIGGGTAYTTLTTAGAHGPLAVQATDGVGGMLSLLLAPRFWVVRVR